MMLVLHVCMCFCGGFWGSLPAWILITVCGCDCKSAALMTAFLSLASVLQPNNSKWGVVNGP